MHATNTIGETNQNAALKIVSIVTIRRLDAEGIRILHLEAIANYWISFDIIDDIVESVAFGFRNTAVALYTALVIRNPWVMLYLCRVCLP